jgi:hypothetical protein
MTSAALARAGDAPSVPGARHAIASWLLDGPALVRDGPHAGAVAGVVGTSGTVAYVYPEIAGYYLQWLAWRAREGHERGRLSARAAAVQHWLRVWLEDATPPCTRLHLHAPVDDWRNEAVFCFDIAMVLRGLASSAQAGLVTVDESVVAGVVRELERLIGADGTFEACVPSNKATALPDRWSTRRGPFLAKAAAGIVTAAQALPMVPGPVLRAAEATFDASVAELLHAPHPELHPLFYAFEGVMALPGHRDFVRTLATVAAQFDQLLVVASRRGTLPESCGTRGEDACGPSRVDVVAQALRIGSLLDAHLPFRNADRTTLGHLRGLLESEVRPSGALPFALRSEPLQWNTWAKMFADQALAFVAEPETVRAHCGSDPLLV